MKKARLCLASRRAHRGLTKVQANVAGIAAQLDVVIGFLGKLEGQLKAVRLQTHTPMMIRPRFNFEINPLTLGADLQSIEMRERRARLGRWICSMLCSNGMCMLLTSIGGFEALAAQRCVGSGALAFAAIGW